MTVVLEVNPATLSPEALYWLVGVPLALLYLPVGVLLAGAVARLLGTGKEPLPAMVLLWPLMLALLAFAFAVIVPLSYGLDALAWAAGKVGGIED